jgi:hypothetical protein
VKNRDGRENGKRILGLMTDGGREYIFSAKGVAKMCGCKAAERKKVEKTRRKVRMQVTFVKGNYFGTPLCTTCKINRAGDKGQSLRKRGRSW